MKDFDLLFNRWLDKESKNLSRQDQGTEQTKAKRTYIHFDKRRQASSLHKYREFFRDTNKVVANAFWPFMHRSIKVLKIKNNKNGQRNKKVKERKVYYASHHDALIYSWYSFLLNEKYYQKILKNLGIDECVIAYRQIPVKFGSNKNKCNIHFAQEVFDYIRNKNKECVAFVSDITGFFDNLDHEHLKREWLRVLGLNKDEDLPDDHSIIYKNLTNFKYVDVEEVYKNFDIKFKRKFVVHNGRGKVFQVPVVNGKPIASILDTPFSRKDFQDKIVKNGLIKGNEYRNKAKKCVCGIMQGSPISATLSNIYMLSFDKRINDLLSVKGGLYRRYSDDLVIVCNMEDYSEINQIVQNEIKKYELEINDSKTDTTRFFLNGESRLKACAINSEIPKNMQYLGFEFNGRDIFIRSSSITKYYRKMKSVIRKTLSIAYGKKSKTKNTNNKVYKKSLYKRFLYKGQRSFISYAFRANNIIRGDVIKHQLKNRFEILAKYFEKKQRARTWIKNKQNPNKI